MMMPGNNSLTSLRYFLLLIALVFALSLTLLVYFFTSAATTIGSTPDFAISMNHGLNTGILQPGEQRWFRLNPNPNDVQYQNMHLSMFFTTDQSSPHHNINFELFSESEIKAWQEGQKNAPVNFGAGMPVSRDGDLRVGERIWQGAVLRDGVYYVALQNNSEARVDYWLSDDNGIAPDVEAPAEPVVEPESLPAAAQGTSPYMSVPLGDTQNMGHLGPDQEVWYSFSIDNTSDNFEPMALTLVFTPDDGNRIRYMTMDIFTSQEVLNWSAENSATLNNVGAGGIVTRDNNPFTGERFWSGWVVSSDLYYVRLKNGNVEQVDYWLFNGDVYQPALASNAP